MDITIDQALELIADTYRNEYVVDNQHYYMETLGTEPVPVEHAARVIGITPAQVTRWVKYGV